MSDSNIARQTEIRIDINGIDITEDVDKYLITMAYTDNEEDKPDDLQLTFDDRESTWLSDWLNVNLSQPSPEVTVGDGEFNTGDVVYFKGGNHYVSSVASSPSGGVCTEGPAKLTLIAKNSKHPYHLIGGAYTNVEGKSNVYGWVDADLIELSNAEPAEEKSGLKGAEIHAVIVQKNWDSDGKDMVLDCGTFEIDSIDASGPPAKISIKATSLAYSSTVSNQAKTRAWENIRLSVIANEVAVKNGMSCMFESEYDPLYERREQIQQSDIVFLQGLCHDAGISLKVTAKTIVLFDAAEYEQKEAVTDITRGNSNIKNYRFSSKSTDTSYSKCHVSYTDPQTGQMIEYTYTPRLNGDGSENDGSGQTLEINEKVNNREEARLLAMKRLRQKNKSEFSAEFSLAGNLRMVAGVTVNVAGFGLFDGKYIIETAVHDIAGGYTVNVKLRRVLEEY